MRLYICYADADRRLIRPLIELVRAAGIEPLFEQTLMEDRIWHEQLELTISICDAFLYTLSARSLKDEWCQWELQKAVQLQVPIIPAVIQPNLTLPPPFADYSTADFTDAQTPTAVAAFIAALFTLRLNLTPSMLPQVPLAPVGLPAHAVSPELGTKPPQTGATLLEMATTLLERARARPNDDIEGKIADYTEAIRLKPNYAEAYARRGATRSLKDDFEGAMEDYNRATELDPNLAYAWLNRGIAHEDQGNPEQALTDYHEAIRANPHYTDALNNRGNLLYAQGDFEGALADYDAVIELAPQQPKAYFNRGNVREKLGELRGAMRDWQRYLNLGGTRDEDLVMLLEHRIEETRRRLQSGKS